MKTTEVTPEQIAKWKEEHGGIYEFPVGDKVAYIRVPNMRDFKRGLKVLTEETEVEFAEEMLDALWLDGDKEIRYNDEYFTPASKKLKKLLDYDDAEVTSLKSKKSKITIAGHSCVIRVITRQDLSTAERANPGGKPFVTQEKLFEAVCIEKDKAFTDKNNAEIRFPLYKALEDLQKTKHAALKKL